MTTSASEVSCPLVHVVDDDAQVCQALAVLLATRGIGARTYVSAEEFLAAVSPQQPVCALIDVRLPGLNGLELVREIGRRKVPAAVVVISGHGDIPMAVSAMRAGAVHFVEKPFEPALLLEVVEEARARMLELDAALRLNIVTAARFATLTPREKEVMALLVEGLPSKLVARRLVISTRTAEHHRAAVMRKMQARTLSHLVRMGLGLELPPLEPAGDCE